MKTKKKAPKQGRSQFTVDAILEGAARILEGRVKENFTTNKVAEIAGVSVGSLYQYFKNKESIVEDLLFKKLSQNLNELFETKKLTGEITEEIFIETIVRQQFELWQKRETLSRNIIKWAPKVIEPKFFLDNDDKIISYLKEKKVEYKLERIKKENIEVALMMSINVIRFTILTYFTSDNKYDSEELISEAVKMIQAYLIQEK